MGEYEGVIGGTVLAAAAAAVIAALSIVGTNPSEHFGDPIPLALFAAGGLGLLMGLHVLRIARIPPPSRIAWNARKVAWYANEYLHGRRPGPLTDKQRAEMVQAVAAIARAAQEGEAADLIEKQDGDEEEEGVQEPDEDTPPPRPAARCPLDRDG